MAKRTRPIEVEIIQPGAKTEPVEQITPEMLRNVRIYISEREIPLWYDMTAEIEIEEKLGIDATEAQDILNDARHKSRIVIRLIEIMGNRGLTRAGEPADLSEKWITEHVIPRNMRTYTIGLRAAMTAGFFMETENPDEQGERDLGLEEIRKKNGKII